MILAAHQPNYLPNLGFFYKMAHCDQFVIFTNVQFGRGDGWQRRHKIVLNGTDHWLSVPVCGSTFQQIKEAQINNRTAWRRRHKLSLFHAFPRTRERALLERLMAVYDREWTRLSELNIEIIKLLRDALGITTPIVFDEDVTGEKDQLLINLCKKYGADQFLSGTGGRQYMTNTHFHSFQSHGIHHRFVEHDLTALFPYSSVQYIFTEGIQNVRNRLLLPEASRTGSGKSFQNIAMAMASVDPVLELLLCC